MFEFIVVVCLLYICWNISDPERKNTCRDKILTEKKSNPYRHRRY